ncbi:hypothetical protein J6TS1_25770 [Siminovitchia terrae]|uniref:Uncharacterized protein n=1 Tax=Siminovitchia terrae TaxID=1914933 RepID=A0ABQ4KXF3_SIMTE|nr:hypothetical protein [Siminovitchia terrae]GIN92262.1 hypothetical protein J22TS1_33130 [Siminovitchia terrae]GIN96707.1 hypothetical protein J6TS1_25770 [Siminovitchia terrae]
MDNETKKALDEILAEGIEMDDVTQKDHLWVVAIGFIPFVISLIWYSNYIS